MITELATNLGPQAITAQEALFQYGPTAAVMGILGIGRLRDFFLKHGEPDIDAAVIEVGNDMVVHGKGRNAFFTHRDTAIRCKGDPKGLSGNEKIVPCRGVLRPGERQRIDRVPPHVHTEDRQNHVPSRRGRCVRNQPDNQDMIDYSDE